MTGARRVAGLLLGAVTLLRIDAAAAQGPADQTASPPARLMGTIVTKALRRAVFAGVNGVLTLAPGEMLDDWEVQSIAPGRVVLLGRGGSQELHLDEAATPRELDPATAPAKVAWRNPCGRVHGFRAAGGVNHTRLDCQAALEQFR